MRGKFYQNSHFNIENILISCHCLLKAENVESGYPQSVVLDIQKYVKLIPFAILNHQVFEMHSTNKYRLHIVQFFYCQSFTEMTEKYGFVSKTLGSKCM